ncbi:MAG: hypothetical protein AAFP02_14325, partial [Bacteroidota bacterium]
SKGVITVPIQAVTLRQPKDDEDADPEEVIFRFNDGRAERINVLTGIADDKYIEIAEGLDEGDQIIVGPYSMLTKMLKDSMEVRIRKNRGENTEEEEEG